MDTSLEMKLIDCLDALEAGEAIDQILAHYPKEAEQLRPMLETAAQLWQLRLQPSLAAQSKSRDLFLAQASQLPSVSPSPRSTLARWRQRLLPLLSLALLLLLLGAGLVTFSAPAIPGDPLYGAKRLVENVRLNLTAGSGARLALSETFNRERIREIHTLLAAGREAQVEFVGLIEAKRDDAWLIAGLPVLINDNSEIWGAAEAGQFATVMGYTSGGSLTAVTITTPYDENLPPPPTIEPESTATVEATATATPTNVPTVTATPPSDDNGNDNNNDNDNNNGNENENDNSNDNDGGNSNDNSNENENDNQNDIEISKSH